MDRWTSLRRWRGDGDEARTSAGASGGARPGWGPIIYGKWRADGAQVERRIGRGWLVKRGDAAAKPRGRASAHGASAEAGQIRGVPS